MNVIRTVFFAMSVLFFSGVLAQKGEGLPMPEAGKKIKVFLLAGQSNMDGRGDGSKLQQDEIQALESIKDKVYLAYNWKPLKSLDVTIPPEHTRKKFSLDKVFGPELFFGLELSKAYPDDKILLIKRSLGGTSLYGCWNPNWTKEKAAVTNEVTKPKLYSDFLKYIESILKDYDEDDYEVCGMLWVQGESDSGVKKNGTKPSETYGENLTNLISGVRAKVKKPEMPFMIMQVGGGEVVKAMKRVANTETNVSFIAQSNDKSADNYLPKYGPPIGHYTYEGMKKIGLLFKNEYVNNYSEFIE